MGTIRDARTELTISRNRDKHINHNMHPTHATMSMPSRHSRGSHKLLRIEPCTPMCASEAVGTEQAQDRCLKQPWWCAADFKQGGSAATGAHPGHQSTSRARALRASRPRPWPRGVPRAHHRCWRVRRGVHPPIVRSQPPSGLPEPATRSRRVDVGEQRNAPCDEGWPRRCNDTGRGRCHDRGRGCERACKGVGRVVGASVVRQVATGVAQEQPFPGGATFSLQVPPHATSAPRQECYRDALPASRSRVRACPDTHHRKRASRTFA